MGRKTLNVLICQFFCGQGAIRENALTNPQGKDTLWAEFSLLQSGPRLSPGESMEEAVIVSAVRTAIGSFQGALRAIPATGLGARVIVEAVRRAGIAPGEMDEVIMGNVLPAGLGQNPARQAALQAKLPFEIGAVTVNKVCGSGLKAVMKELGIDPKRCNIRGGAISLGHPIEASGARVLTTLLYAMEEQQAKRGMASLCLGGGEAVSLIVEKI